MTYQKKLLAVLMLIILATSLFSTNWEIGELIVTLKENTRGEAIQTLLFSYTQFELTASEVLSNRFNVHLFTFNPTLIDCEDMFNLLNSDDRVEFAEFNLFVYPQSQQPADPYFNLQWALLNTGQIIEDEQGIPGADISAIPTWELLDNTPHGNSKEIVVAVIDSAPCLYHEDINFWRNHAETLGDGIDNDGNGYIDDYYGWDAIDKTHLLNLDPDSHGTHVSGIVSAIKDNNIGISGLSNDIKVMPIRALRNTGFGHVNFIYSAYNYVYENRLLYNTTNGNQGVYIVAANSSFSWHFGTPLRSAIREIIIKMTEEGILVPVSAGNSGVDLENLGIHHEDFPYPAGYKLPGMITVTTTTNTDDLRNNWGNKTVHLGAPGYQIFSTLENNTYGYLSGTSMATPQVSATVGLLYSVASDDLLDQYKDNPSFLALLIKDFILDGVDVINSLIDKTITEGRLNVFNSVSSFLEYDQVLVKQNMEISNQSFLLEERYTIYDGATLTISNTNIEQISDSHNSKFYGFNIHDNSKLIIINSQIDAGFIRGFGENAEIHILGNSKVTINNEVVIDSSSLIVNNSSLILNNAKLTMKNSQKVEFTNNSTLSTYGASEIIGHSTGFSDNPGPGLVVSGDLSMLNIGLLTPGDRLVFMNSSLICSSATKIYHPEASSGGRFDGIMMFNSFSGNGRRKICQFGELVEGLHYIVIQGTSFSANSTIIQYITQLIIMNQSDFVGTNMSYQNNSYGIIVNDSSMSIANSFVINNGNLGLNLENLVGVSNMITDSTIADNVDTGIRVRNGFITVSNTTIDNNGLYGFNGLSTTKSFIINGSVLSNHTVAEISALGNAFPMFRPERQMPNYVKPVMPSSFLNNHYYLMALSPISSVINAHNLIVNTQNQNKFYPSFSDFLFDTNSLPPKALIMDALEYIINEDFDLALETFKYIVANYEDSEDAIHSLAIMPYLYQTLELDLADLNLYLDDYINHDNLNSITLDTKARTMMYAEYYNDAIDLYDEIINTSDSEITQLLAIIDQMWCHLKLTENTRNLGSAALYQPSNYAEYSEIKDSLLAQIKQFNLEKESEPLDSLPPSTTQLISNYPNPFNPSTTISFDIAEAGVVRIDVYNIRGQRVSTLINENMSPRTHSTNWNGTDENGLNVASGVYFYQLRVGEITQTKRMLLMK